MNARNERGSRGIALVLVLVAVAVAVILALSFQTAQSTTLPIAQNVNHHAEARQIAESAMAMAIAHVKSSDTWRQDFAAGKLPTNQSFAQGTFTLLAEDGQDLDGDGVIGIPDEGDGDLADDPNDAVTLTVIARVNNVTHKLRAVVNSFEDPGARMKLLMVVSNATSPSGADTARIKQMEQWNFEVAKIAHNATQAAFDAALDDADVAYISNSSAPSTVGSKLNNAAIGIVSEPAGMALQWALASSVGSVNHTRVNVTDNTHDITQPLAVGLHDVHTETAAVNSYTLPSSTTGDVLATPQGSLQASLAAFEAGSSTTSGGATAGRRVLLPVGGGTFHFGVLAGDGKTIVYRSLIWASKAPKGPPAVAHWRLDESTDIIASDSAGTNHGTVYEGGNWTAGKFLNGFDFNGIKNYIQIPNSKTFDIKSSITICAWVYGRSWTSSSEAGAGNINPILRKGEGNPNVWQFAINTGVPTLYLDGTDNGSLGSGRYRSNTTLDKEKWYHLAATWDRSTVRIYVNGVVDNNGQASSHTKDVGTDKRPLYIGGRAGADTNDRFHGIIDDVRLFNRALSGAEIRTIMNEAIAADANPTPQLLARYDFVEQKPEPTLVGHWLLADSGGGGGGMAAQSKITLSNTARVDSYRSSKGAYDPTDHVSKYAVVATNSTSSGYFNITHTAVSLWGDAYCGKGSNPSSVISAHEGTISGLRSALTDTVTIGSASPGISTFPNQLSTSSISSSQTWSTTRTYTNSLSISGSSTNINVTQDITVYCRGSLSIANANFVISPGKKLTLWVNGNLTLTGSATINADSTRPDAVRIYAHNSSSAVTLRDTAQVAAFIHSNKNLNLEDSAELFGAALANGELLIKDDARAHLDLDMPNLGVAYPPASDETGTNNGSILGGATSGSTGGGGLLNLIGNLLSSLTEALNFDGSNDRVEIRHHDDYLLTDGAISFWFRSTKSGTRQGLFSKDASGTGDGQVAIWIDSNKINAKLESASATYTIATSGSLPTNTWHHVTLTFGQGGMKLYVNGSEVGTHSHNGGLGDPINRTGNFEDIVLAACLKTSTSGYDYLAGSMSDVRLYDYVLDATQVNNLYKGNDIGPSSLPGPVVVDDSGFGSPSNLPIPDVSKITWISGGGLAINANQPLKTLVNATKIHQGVTRTKQVTIEAVFVPSSNAMGATGTIFGYGPVGSGRNVGLQQQNAAWAGQIKIGGSVQSANSGNVLGSGVREHMIVTYDGKNITRYRNGQWLDSTEVTGDFASWVASHPLTIAGEADGSRPWTGELHRIAIYDRAFNKVQAKNVFNGQLPGTGASTGTGAVRFIEMP